MSAISTTMVAANGLTFEVDQCGDGDKLALCLHGFPECAFSWRYQLPLLARLGYTAWSPNLRGYGKSSRPKNVADYAIVHLVEDVAGLIDAAGKREVLLIGHDWGGAIGWNFLYRRLRPIARYIVMNLPHPVPFFKTFYTSGQVWRSWYMYFFQLPWLPEWMFRQRFAKAVGEAFYNMAIDKSRFPPEVLDVYRKNAMEPGGLTAMLNYYRALFRNWPSRGFLKELEMQVLDVPTLMIWGEKDTALLKGSSVGTEKYVRDFTLRYVADVSHWVQQEAPETVNAMMEAWLTGKPVPYAGPGGKVARPPMGDSPPLAEAEV